MGTLDQFYTMTGLKVNLHKSDIMLAGVSDVQSAQITQMTGMSINHHTVSYLGLPLSTSKISINQCLPLYEKITARLNCWTSRTLSQAGRLTLIKSVIFSMHVYWLEPLFYLIS